MVHDKEVTHVDTSNPLWAAMVFLATVAYPEDWSKRDRAMLAMKAVMYRAARRFGKPIGTDAKAVFSQMPVQQQSGTLRRLSARLQKRLVAGRVASSLLSGVRRLARIEYVPPAIQQRTRMAMISRGVPYKRALTMTMTKQHIAGAPWTLNDHAKAYPGGPARFKSDVWRPEILHLIKAFHTVALEWRDPRGFNVLRLLANPGWSRRALESAERLASLLPRTSNLPQSLRRAVATPRVRLVPYDGTVEIPEPAPGE